jgi:hypothetical protein
MAHHVVLWTLSARLSRAHLPHRWNFNSFHWFGSFNGVVWSKRVKSCREVNITCLMKNFIRVTNSLNWTPEAEWTTKLEWTLTAEWTETVEGTATVYRVNSYSRVNSYTVEWTAIVEWTTIQWSEQLQYSGVNRNSILNSYTGVNRYSWLNSSSGVNNKKTMEWQELSERKTLADSLTRVIANTRRRGETVREFKWRKS